MMGETRTFTRVSVRA